MPTYKEFKLNFWQWYKILRAHHHWTFFECVRWALWLSR